MCAKARLHANKAHRQSRHGLGKLAARHRASHRDHSVPVNSVHRGRHSLASQTGVGFPMCPTGWGVPKGRAADRHPDPQKEGAQLNILSLGQKLSQKTAGLYCCGGICLSSSGYGLELDAIQRIVVDKEYA
jgi:hypothetical protein